MSNSSFGNTPSIDPADNDSLAGTLRLAQKKFLQKMNTRLPASVISYDRTTNRAQLQILISQVTTNGSIVSRSQLASIPVKRYGGGGYVLSFPLAPGDLGWVEANDRDISLFLQSYEESPPNSGRMFDFSDSVFFPDYMDNYTVGVGDLNNAVLSNLDGTVKITLTPAGVIITSPTVTVAGALDATGGITANGGTGPTPINITGNMLLTGNLQVSGFITAGGAITPDTPP
jgi:hypothetical protein